MRKTPIDWLARSRLNARQLALIVQLDEKRSVLQAAEAAHMTQPAASKLLQTVEDALGVELFTRHSRGVAPTAYGEIVARHARAVLAEFKRGHDLSPGAAAMLTELREVAARLYPRKATKLR